MPAVAEPRAQRKPRQIVYRFSKNSKKTYGFAPKSKVATAASDPSSPKEPKKPGQASKMAKAAGAAAGTVCKKTGKVLRTTSIVWPLKLLLTILDVLAAPYGKMRGRDINFPLLWKAGAILLVMDAWIFVLITKVGYKVAQDLGGGVGNTTLIVLAQTLIPGAIALGALSLIIGGIRLQQGKSFLQLYGADLEPLPAFESGIAFKLGDIKLSLRDMHTNIGAFGGIGTGKTVSVMIPLMRQFFQQLNHDTDDPEDEAQKVAALILDEKGDFIDSTIMEMILAGRPITDLVLIDPDLDLFRYNPLDPSQSADENAEKLGKVQKILGGSGGSDNKYWEDTSKSTIKYFLQLLEVYKPKEKIGLDDIARFMRDDQLATMLCDQVEATIQEKRESNEINEETFGMIDDAISSTRNQWIQLSANTKSILKTTINQMLSNLASNPRLQKVFCRDTNFNFKDLPNKGKIVLFRGSGIDKATAKLICVCLKIDFQTWQKRRNGSAAAAYGLNTTRTVLFICDEYQEFVTCGGEGDETFYGVSRSARTCAIVATQSLNSLKTSIKNQEQTNTLIQNITTWVFLRTTDKDTMELGSMWAGQSKQEDYSQSQNTGGMIEVASNLSGGSGKDSSVNISRKLEENFRKDDFSKLITMTMEKSRTGPWYSEAIIYNYHDTDAEAESRCYRTKINHYYYSKEMRKRASSNVSHLDNLLYDRTWQRKTLQRALVEIAQQRALAKKRKETFLEEMALAGRAPQEVPTEKDKKARLLSQAQAGIQEDTKLVQEKTKGKPLKGQIAQEKRHTPEEIAIIRKRMEELRGELANTSNDEAREKISGEIGRLTHIVSMEQLLKFKTQTQRTEPATKEVLEATAASLSEPLEAAAQAAEGITADPAATTEPPSEEEFWTPEEGIENLEEFTKGISRSVLSPYGEPEEPEGYETQGNALKILINAEDPNDPDGSGEPSEPSEPGESEDPNSPYASEANQTILGTPPDEDPADGSEDPDDTNNLQTYGTGEDDPEYAPDFGQPQSGPDMEIPEPPGDETPKGNPKNNDDDDEETDINARL
jgi:hypothetical protein